MDVAEHHVGVPVARTIEGETLMMLGGPLDLVASIEEPAGDAVLFRGPKPAASTVPLHSHVDPECFLVLEREIEVVAGDGRGWRTVAEMAGRCGYWMASPDEHATVTGRPLGR